MFRMFAETVQGYKVTVGGYVENQTRTDLVYVEKDFMIASNEDEDPIILFMETSKNLVKEMFEEVESISIQWIFPFYDRKAEFYEPEELGF